MDFPEIQPGDDRARDEFLVGVMDCIVSLASKLEEEGVLSREEIAEGFEQSLRDYSVRPDCQHPARSVALKAMAECFRTKGAKPS